MSRFCVLPSAVRRRPRTWVLARIAAHDRVCVWATAVENATCVPTRLLPDRHDQPYRYVLAGREMVDALLATCDATIQATAQRQQPSIASPES